ncbi:hypothetical protein B2J93_5864 [Marssonina coronariae]|uniref:Uncharacterized protein n=1 Tax=Diplocarpon coronariae TaxID=2795749 RepID=A0A218Z9H8_9HELO|nr:hypothetical protein B2J93_5864 [Marssonina coronariae]
MYSPVDIGQSRLVLIQMHVYHWRSLAMWQAGAAKGCPGQIRSAEPAVLQAGSPRPSCASRDRSSGPTSRAITSFVPLPTPIPVPGPVPIPPPAPVPLVTPIMIIVVVTP